ncbi:MAG: 50S ribosomal protein L2, partial [Pirellulales bacterium]|nr:50S ribosomal protein L2 [Pirellulales bacterium]
EFGELTRSDSLPENFRTRKKKNRGRIMQGKMFARDRGGDLIQHYRLIDFRRNKDGIPGKVDSIQYDPNRTCRIALIHYADGEKRFILSPDGLKVGGTVVSGADASPEVGNSLPLSAIPLSTTVHNIELQPGRGGRMCRSAGTSATLMAREAGWAQISLPSGEIRRVPAACRATIGAIGNSEHMNVRLGKAGRSRWLGRRPHVRGTAMNPIDHPHGGGEGRTKGGRHPVSPTGKSAKGGGTRKPRKPSGASIIRRRKSKRYGQIRVK